MSVTTIKPQTPIAQMRTQLMAMTPEFKNALPSHITPEKFQRVILTVVQQQPDLLNADRRSLFASCLKCAADGLIPDGREAALVLFGRQVTYIPMFGGIQKRIRNSGEVASVQAHVIYEKDHFIIRRGLNETIEHTPLFPGDRGQAIGAYAIAKFKNGSDPVFEVMDREEIEKVRSVSRAAKNGPWVQWWDQQARKTVFKRLAKWLPMDADVDELIRRDDEIGAPTEPSGAMDDAPVIEADAFETASTGTDPTEDPDEAQAQDFITQIGTRQTREEVEAFTANAAVKRRLAAWTKEKLALQQKVLDAAAAAVEKFGAEGR